MGVVCAEDTNQTAQSSIELPQDTLDITNDNLLADTEKSFTDLSGDINNTVDSITLGSNYKYNDGDAVTSIVITRNYTINGNNHSIDCNGKVSAFKIVNSTVTINNLILRNGNGGAILAVNSNIILSNVEFDNNFAKFGGGILAEGCNLTVNGARFINNNATSGSGICAYQSSAQINNTLFENNTELYGGALYIEESLATVTNSKFIDNYGNSGSAITVLSGLLNIENGLFANKNPVYWSLVYGQGISEINIVDSVFANTTSKYATAVYNDYNTTIKRSKFINLKANATAGAVAIKTPEPKFTGYLTITDSEFTNVSASKNGGAIFVDINSGADYDKTYGEVKIHNTTFNNCSAEFGGAILQLGGNLDLDNSTFTENSAINLGNGGAVYASNTTVKIANSIFRDNKVQIDNGLGGALYIDFGAVYIEDSDFTNNIAKSGGAVYTFDSYYEIKNSKFTNNGEDIHTYFDEKGSSIVNCSGVYKAVINDHDFNISLRFNGNEIILNKQKINGSASDAYFNLKDLGLVTPVRNQGSMGSCWAFGAAGAFESAFLIATNISLDISENNIQDLGLRYSVYGRPTNTESGSFTTSTSYFLSWLGAIDIAYDEYDELGKISAVNYSPDAYRVVEAIFLDVNDKAAVKKALTTYGAVNLFIYGANSNDKQYYNPKTSAVYYYGNESGNHYVTLVGWDDNFSKDNFVKQAPGNGAWICKNSWGTDWGDEGYFYISYYDKSLINGTAVTFSFDNNIYYEKLYQNELTGVNSFESKYNTYSQIFISEGGDIIAAVGSYFEEDNAPYTISIYVNNYLTYKQSGNVAHAGYNTIKLDKYILVDNNQSFEVRITTNSVPIVENTRLPLKHDMNYVLMNDKFSDVSLKGLVAPIKAYTFKNPGISENINKFFDTNETIFYVKNVEGNNLTVNFNGKNYIINISNGEGNVSFGVLPVGEYLATINYKNQTFSNQVLVKTTIDTGDTYSVTIGYNTKLTFTAQFLDSDGNPLNGTLLTVKFDSQTLKDETTPDGKFSIDIGSGVKIGTHTISYYNPISGENATVKIKIVSRFSGNKNVNMYYYDGSSYKVRIVGNDGKFVGKNQVVTIKIGKKTYKVKTNANGYAVLKIPNAITPGKYTIAATYAGQTVKNQLTVKQVLKTTKTVTVKKSAKKLVLKASLKKGKTALKNKVIKFKVNGKIYKAKTNKKGLAKYTLKKSAIKKLKAGKKYTIKVAYLKDVVKSTLKVKR